VWNQVNLRDLMEKLEPARPKVNNVAKLKAKLEDDTNPAPESAYLGLKLWSKPISIQEFNDDDFDIMNIEDFLLENNLSNKDTEISENVELQGALKCDEKSPEPDEMRCTSMASLSLDSPQMSPTSSIESARSPVHFVAPSPRPGVIVSTKKEVITPTPNIHKQLVREPTPEGNSFLYAESKRARLEREKAERKRKLEEEIEFAAEDLALATVPGVDFDPRTRNFDVEELKPQPIIRKRAKIYVPDEAKDDRYWDKRCKNNFAARRSREARRLKENQIALRAAYLEKQNQALRRELEDAKFNTSKLAMERDILKKKLHKYENMH